MKKKLSVILIVLMLFIGINPIVASGSTLLQLEINNEAYDFIDEPLLLQDSIFMPLREVAEEMGYEIQWSEEDRSIDLTKDDESLKLYIDSQDVVLNGINSKLVYSPIIKDDKTYASIDFFSNYLNNIVALSNGYISISIDSKRDIAEDIFSESDDEELKGKLKDFMEIYTENQNFQGSVLVAKGNEILLNDGFGYSNVELGIANNSQTKFAIGSITKQFVSTGIVQLEEKGLLKFDDAVSKYVDGLKYGDDITIHNLLTHTSGLVNVTDLPEFYALSDASAQEVIALVKDNDLILNPGEQFMYNNTNYILLGMILEKVSGETMEDYFHNHFFEPLGMMDTGVAYGKNPTNIATPYQGYIDVFEVDDKPLLAHAYGAGNVYSTVEDMYRWNKALQGNEILSDKAREKLFEGQVSMGGTVEYAYGWMTGEDENGKYYMHDGSTLGFSALSHKNVSRDTTIVILANRRMQDMYGMSAYLETVLNGNDIDYSLVPRLPEETELSEAEFEKYTGRYIVFNPLDMTEMVMDVFAEEGSFFLQVEGQEKIRIYSQRNDNFFMKLLDARMAFGINEEGISDKITFTQMGIDFKGYKEGHKPEDVVIDKETLSKYAGIYELSEGFDLDITLEDGALYVTPTGQGKIALKPVSETKFELMIVDASIEFIVGENGEINSLDYKQGEYEAIAERK